MVSFRIKGSRPRRPPWVIRKRVVQVTQPNSLMTSETIDNNLCNGWCTARARTRMASLRYLQIVSLPPPKIASSNGSGARAPLRVTAQYRMQKEGGLLLLCGSCSTAYRRCVAFLVFVSVSKLGHPAKLEQRDVINAYAVDGNHGLRIERKTGAACGGEEVS